MEPTFVTGVIVTGSVNSGPVCHIYHKQYNLGSIEINRGYELSTSSATNEKMTMLLTAQDA
jgi:hypothetical protein